MFFVHIPVITIATNVRDNVLLMPVAVLVGNMSQIVMIEVTQIFPFIEKELDLKTLIIVFLNNTDIY